MFAHVVKGISSGSRVFRYISSSETTAMKHGLKLDQVAGRVEFRGVNFYYPTRTKQVYSMYLL